MKTIRLRAGETLRVQVSGSERFVLLSVAADDTISVARRSEARQTQPPSPPEALSQPEQPPAPPRPTLAWTGAVPKTCALCLMPLEVAFAYGTLRGVPATAPRLSLCLPCGSHRGNSYTIFHLRRSETGVVTVR